MALQDFVYQNAEVTWRVEILGQDVSDRIALSGVGSIRQTLDTQILTEFQSGDCQITLSDPNGDFSTSKSENFFTQNAWAASGYLARIEVFGGYRNPSTGASEETRVFKGFILSVHRDSKTGLVTLNASDNSAIHRQQVSNFGMIQQVELPEGERRSIRGTYDVNPLITPISDDSVTATLSGTDGEGQASSEVMREKKTFDDFGELSETAFQMQQSRGATQLLTEEAVSSLTDPKVSAQLKTPYRYEHVLSNVRKVSSYFNVQPDIVQAIEPAEAKRFFASLGRLQARYEQDTANETFSWRGNVTDFIVHPETQMIYALISGTRAGSVPNVLPRLVSYDSISEVSRVIYTPATYQEYWRLATADFDTLYILKSLGRREAGRPRRASYNPAEWNAGAMPETAIVRYQVSEQTVSEIAGTGTVNRPQLATYHAGSGDVAGGRREERLGFIPDTRQNFTFARGVLWYRFANRSMFGLNRWRPSDGDLRHEITIPIDGRNNEASFDFIIDEANDKIFGAHTTQSSTESTILVYEKALAASY